MSVLAKEAVSNKEGLKLYKELLEKIAENHERMVVPNKDHQHAAIAIGVIMDNTENKFLLFDDDLSNDIVKHNNISNFQEKFIKMLDRGVETKIVISDKDTPQDDLNLKNFFKKLVLEYDNLLLKEATSRFKEEMRKIYNQKINFAVGDYDKLRLEFYGNKAVKDRDRSAFISFYDRQSVEEVREPFEKYFFDNSDYFDTSDYQDNSDQNN